jgi:UDP-3-O-[3-hydroxymyristoyl] glucosamine N-acyltransferase
MHMTQAPPIDYYQESQAANRNRIPELSVGKVLSLLIQEARIEMNDEPVNSIIEGDMNGKITGISSIREAGGQDLTFCSWDGEKGVSLIKSSAAAVILCKKSLQGRMKAKSGTTLVFLENPKLAFIRLARRLYLHSLESKKGISKLARISKSAKVGPNCYVGDFAVIGDNCVIEDNTAIYERAVIKNARIGSGCLIFSGVSIGDDGFAYERGLDGTLEQFPHFGRVVIGNNVEICANVSIARGSLCDTVIGDGTKLDAQVHVAHNTRIGKNCQLTAGTIIGGSVTMGDSCWTGLNSTIKNKVALGNNVVVGAGACVINDVPDGDVVAGVPARSIKHKVRSDELYQMAGQSRDASNQETITKK